MLASRFFTNRNIGVLGIPGSNQVLKPTVHVYYPPVHTAHVCYSAVPSAHVYNPPLHMLHMCTATRTYFLSTIRPYLQRMCTIHPYRLRFYEKK